MIRHKSHDGFAKVTFGDLVPVLSNRTCFLILDRDGTLVEINSNPLEAVLNSSVKSLLENTAALLDGRVAIVSARGLNCLLKEFDSRSFILAGNYGLEISFPTGRQFVHPEATKARFDISALMEELSPILQRYPLLRLDNHAYSLCLHFRHQPEDQQEALHCLIKNLEKKYFLLSFRRLPTSYEIIPPVHWNKASALDKIAAELSLESDDLFYVVFGDSDADEPMFLWVNHRQGMSFNVGRREETQASCHVNTPDDVIEFISNLARLLTSEKTAEINQTG
ncbi:MAG: trehalose-phosphatase [Candidatus Melainabacteria bacterium]|nr:trehalose-phosphatase [Candidatus Melainabacteria bacterium]